MYPVYLRAPFALLAMTAALTAFADDGGNHALTIYSTATPGAVVPDMMRSGGGGYSVPGYATVRHEREIALNAGRNTVRFTDVAGLIDPTTVSFASLTDPTGTRVMEQNFQFDLVSPEKLLRRFIDRDIAVEHVLGERGRDSGRHAALHSGRDRDPRSGRLGSHAAVQRRRETALAARRADHPADTGMGRRREARPESTRRGCPIRPPASPGGRTTT